MKSIKRHRQGGRKPKGSCSSVAAQLLGEPHCRGAWGWSQADIVEGDERTLLHHTAVVTLFPALLTVVTLFHECTPTLELCLWKSSFISGCFGVLMTLSICFCSRQQGMWLQKCLSHPMGSFWPLLKGRCSLQGAGSGISFNKLKGVNCQASLQLFLPVRRHHGVSKLLFGPWLNCEKFSA